jgi:WD40 repeat protein
MTNYYICILAFSHDYNILMTRYEDTLDIWDLQTGSYMCSLKGYTNGIKSITFSPCRNMIATSSHDHTIQVWNTFSFNCWYVLKGHSDQVWAVGWLVLRNKVVSESEDNTVKV